MNVMISGDIHGSTDIRKLSNSAIRTKFGHLPDVLICAGDFGFPWSNNPENAEDNYYRRWFEQKPYKVIVVLGNHENYARILALPLVELYGAKVRQYGSNIFFVEKNEVLTIGSKTFYCFGGASSYDKESRVIWMSWWPEEDATYGDYIALKEKVQKFPKVDYVVTHTCPEQWVPLLGSEFDTLDNCPTRKVLDELATLIQYDAWFFGHFHKDRQVGDKAFCLYQTLKELSYE
jgi:predicted phosphodiesterase